MIMQKSSLDQLPLEMRPAFQELSVLKHLKNQDSKRLLAIPVPICLCLFSYTPENWFYLLESAKGEAFPGKDTVYRFLNHSRFAWRRFLTSLNSETVQRVETLTSVTRTSVFIVDRFHV